MQEVPVSQPPTALSSLPTETKEVKKQAPKKKKKKKRHRPTKSREEEEAEWKQERYDKLLHMANKDLTKHAKLVRAFESQKVIRRIKDQSKSSNNDSINAKQEQQHLQSQSNAQLLLDEWKSLPLDIIVNQALSRLGLLHLNPKWEAGPANNNNTNNDSAQDTAMESKVQKVLHHKKMESCLETWNLKVTEYRRWRLNLTERYEPGFSGHDKLSTSSRKKTKKQHAQKETDGNNNNNKALANNASMFCDLGGGQNEEQNDITTIDDGGGFTSAYGPGAEYFDEHTHPVAKKNRKGQRARRAKAMAMRAKRDGRVYKSINWRSEDGKKNKPAPSHENNNHNNNNNRTRKNPEPAPTSRAESKDAATSHPSWAAKQAQKSGIVAFKGTKIIFD